MSGCSPKPRRDTGAQEEGGEDGRKRTRRGGQREGRGEEEAEGPACLVSPSLLSPVFPPLSLHTCFLPPSFPPLSLFFLPPSSPLSCFLSPFILSSLSFLPILTYCTNVVKCLRTIRSTIRITYNITYCTYSITYCTHVVKCLRACTRDLYPVFNFAHHVPNHPLM